MSLSVSDFLKQHAGAFGGGAVALIFVEDEVEISSTIRHHLKCGFAETIVLMPDAFALSDELAAQVHRVSHDFTAGDRLEHTVNAFIKAFPGCWFYYCYNAEYLFYPFSEDRSVGEMLSFHAEERRDAMLSYVVDLYAADLSRDENAVSLDDAMLDKSGYYAQARPDPATRAPLERQLDFYGGLRWRFEEHIPEASRRIDRIALFRAKSGLEFRDNHTFSDAEYNTYACPWHNNLTAAICSFRTAKALRRNPGSRFDIDSFRWRNSVPFDWSSRQLLDLGLIEPGQWF